MVSVNIAPFAAPATTIQTQAPPGAAARSSVAAAIVEPASTGPRRREMRSPSTAAAMPAGRLPTL